MSPPKRGTGAWASDIRSSPQGAPADHRKIDRACAGRQHRQSECDGGGLRTVDKNVHGIVPIRPCSCASTQACGRPVGALQTRLRFFTFSLGGPGPLRRGRGINQLFTFEGEPVLFTFEGEPLRAAPWRLCPARTECQSCEIERRFYPNMPVSWFCSLCSWYLRSQPPSSLDPSVFAQSLAQSLRWIALKTCCRGCARLGTLQ